MAISPRLIRRRIKSVTNTRKITKAMELVAAAKMRRATQATLASRPYAEAAWRAIKEIARIGDPSLHPLLAKKTGTAASGKKLAVVITSDRGLCGGFNSQLLRTYNTFVRKQPRAPQIAAIGKKGQDALRRAGADMVAAFTGLGDSPNIKDIRAVADLAVGDFTTGKYDEVWIAYTDYRSALSQTPNVKRLLPITHIEGLGDVADATMQGKAHSGGEALTVGAKGTTTEYVFEPSPDAVLDVMLPRLVEAQIRQALLESTASEHAARMMAMRSATDAASDMIDDLTLTYNQARQAGITREIAEISSGKAALDS